MVFYISSQASNQTIGSTVQECGEIIIDYVVDNHLLLKKWMKANISKFSAEIDKIIIDIYALDDAEEDIVEAINSYRILYDESRIIIIAPNRVPGDKMLAELFGLGIQNIIATTDYLEMKKELTVSLSEKGKSYKDALVFKDIKNTVAVVEEKKKAVIRVQIGLAGTQRRIGTTHTTIQLASYLRSKGYLVAVCERNLSGDFERLRDGQGAKMQEQQYFVIDGIDFYPGCKEKEAMKPVLEKSYNFILCDFGELDITSTQMRDYCRSHVRILVAGTKPWEFGFVSELISQIPDDVLEKVHICFNFAYPDYEKPLKREMKLSNGDQLNVHFLEYQAEPFLIKKFEIADEILADYLMIPAEPVKKQFWILKKLKRGSA